MQRDALPSRACLTRLNTHLQEERHTSCNQFTRRNIWLTTRGSQTGSDSREESHKSFLLVTHGMDTRSENANNRELKPEKKKTHERITCRSQAAAGNSVLESEWKVLEFGEDSFAFPTCEEKI